MATLTEEEKKKRLAKIASNNTPTQIGPVVTSATTLKSPVPSTTTQPTVATPTTSSGGSVVSAPTTTKSSFGTFTADDMAKGLNRAVISGMNQIGYENKLIPQYAKELYGTITGNQNLVNDAKQKSQAALTDYQNKQNYLDERYGVPETRLGNIVSNAVTGAVNMAPLMVTGVGTKAVTSGLKVAPKVANTAVKLATDSAMFAQTAPSANVQALNDGATDKQALAYSGLNGVANVLSEKVFAGIPGLPKSNIDDWVMGKISKGIDNKTMAEFAKWVTERAGEGLEEVVVDVADPYLKRATYDKNAANATLDQLFDSFATGAVTSAMLGSAASVPNVARNVQQNLSPTAIQNRQQAREYQALNGIDLQTAIAQAQKSSANAESDVIAKAQAQQTAAVNRINELSQQIPQTPEQALQDRDWQSVGSRSTNAVMYDNPAMKSDIQRTASEIYRDYADNGQKGQRSAVQNRETGEWTNTSTTRQQNSVVTNLLDMGMTYSQIEDGFQRIAEDSGRENTANAKRVEMEVLSAMAGDGWTGTFGDSYRSDGTMDSEHAVPLTDIAGMNEEQLNKAVDNVTRLLSEASAQGNLIAANEYEAQLDQIQSAINNLNAPAQNVASNATNVRENEVPRESLSPRVREYVENAEKRSGLKFRVVDSLSNAEANGMYDDGVITITADALDNPAVMRRVVFHEIVHSVRGTESHKELIDYAFDYYAAKYEINKDDLLRVIADRYIKADPARAGRYDISTPKGLENVKDEIAAMFIGEACNYRQVASKLCAEKPSLARKILDLLKSFAERIRRVGMSDSERAVLDTVNKAAKSFEDGLNAVRENGGYRAVENVDSEMYAFDMEAIKREFISSVDEIKEKGPRNDRPIIMGYTSDKLKYVGMPNNAVYITPRHIYTMYYDESDYNPEVFHKTSRDHFHNLKEKVKEIPDAILDPLAIATSKTRADSVVLLTKLKSNENYVIAAMTFNGDVSLFTSGSPTRSHSERTVSLTKMSSGYGRPVGDLFDASRLLYVDKKIDSKSRGARLLLPGDSLNLNLNDNLSRFRNLVKEYKNGNAQLLDEEQRRLSAEMRLNRVQNNPNRNPIIVSEGDVSTGAMYNIRSFDEGEMESIAHDLNKKYKKSEAEVDAIVGQMKSLRDYMEDLGNETDSMGDRLFPYLYEWNNKEVLKYSNGKPVMSWIKKNGEYDMNVEASLVCVKKEPMNRILQYMVDNGIYDISNFRSTDYAVVTRILNEYGLRIPCGACFVENRRENTGPDMFRKMASEFNELVEASGVLNGQFNEKAIDEQIRIMDARKTEGEDGTAAATARRYKKFIKENPSKVRLISASEFMTPEGALRLKRDMPAVYSIATSRYGAGTAKPVEPKTPYSGEVRRKKPTRNGKWSTKGALKVGGVRNQSFSDDEASLFLDQCQKYLDFALNELPAQEYTKVPYHARMFGMTGAKMNLSMFPEAMISAEDRAHLSKLTREQKEKDPVFLRAQANAGLDANGNFLWNPESFGWDNAVELCEDPRYSGNVAPNAVGVSDKQIWMLFENKYIGQVIPYHKSGQNNDVAAMRNTDLFKDYSNYQNDMMMDENTFRLPGESDASFYSRVGARPSYGNKIPKNNKLRFNFYDDLAETGDPVQTSKNFIEACKKQNIIPRFPQFIYKPNGEFNENYWKCITDYPLVDINGNYKPMEPIRFDEQHLPENWKEILRTALTEEQQMYKDISKYEKEIANKAANEIRKSMISKPQFNVETGNKFSGSFSLTDDSEYNRLLDEYGAMEPGENPLGNNRDIQVPASTDGTDKTRRFNRTAMEAEQVAGETVSHLASRLSANVNDGKMTYTPITNKATMETATSNLDSQINEYVNDGYSRTEAIQEVLGEEARTFHGMVAGNQLPNATDIAKAERMIQLAQEVGDYQLAADVITDMAVVGTQIGQSMQAYSMLKRMSPEGQLIAFRRSTERINKEQEQKGGRRIEIPQGFEKAFLEANSQKKREELVDQAYKEIAQQVEGTWIDKINAYRYGCMLCNPATHLRNLISNGAMFTVGKMSDTLSGAMQDAFNRNGEKTKSLRGLNQIQRRQLAGFVDDAWENTGKRAMAESGSRYNNETSKINQNKRIFKNGVLEATIGNGDYSVSSMLEKEDMLGKEINFKSALIDYLIANNLSEADCKNGVVKENGASFERGLRYAEKQARKRTFTEDNLVSNAINDFENKTGVAGKIVLGGLMPFRRTPLNIMVRGIEYSPAGIGMTIYKAVKAKKGTKGLNGSFYDINDVLDSLGANFTGSAIMAAGFWLAGQGLLNAGGGDDDKKDQWEKDMGEQDFAIVLPDGSTLSIDWLSPIAMPLLSGASAYRVMHNNNGEELSPYDVTRIAESIGKIADPAFEMSCMQGVTSALKSYSSGTVESGTNVLLSTATSYGGQFIPQVVSKTAQAIDDTRRSSYAPKDGPVPKKIAQFANQQQNKIPFASMQNEASIDRWGRDAKREFSGDQATDFAKRLANGLLNPSVYSSNKKTKIDMELDKLYDKVGDAGVYPSKHSSYVTYGGETLYMDAQQYTQYGRTKGQKSEKYVANLMNSASFSKLSDDSKVAVIKDLYGLAQYEAKKQFVKDKTGKFDTSSYKSYESAIASGNPVKYYTNRQIASDAGISLNSDYEQIMKDCDKLKLSYTKYASMNSKISGMKADKDRNGKTISGSKKSKVVAYLNQEYQKGKITYAQWKYIYQQQGYK